MSTVVANEVLDIFKQNNCKNVYELKEICAQRLDLKKVMLK